MGLVLAQAKAKLTGTFSSDHTGELPVEGDIAESALKLTTTKGSPESRITLSAIVKADGTLSGQLSAPSADMTWTATRAAAR
jgi:hypothetical protein